MPGFHHDVCSTVQSMAPLSPFFLELDLERLGVELCRPEVAFAHPLDQNRAGAVFGTVGDTAAALGADGAEYVRLFAPLVEAAATIVPTVLAPLRSPPRDPIAMARFAVAGVPSVAHLIRRFSTDEAKGLLAGVGAHAMLPLDAPLTAAFGIFLTIVAHAGGWPLVKGGSARLVDALLSELTSAGGTVHTGRWVKDVAELPAARAVLFDTSLETLLAVAGQRLPARYRDAVGRFRHGPGICKVDWALSGPVPWTASVCRRAGTVHVGGSFDEVAASESEVAAGRHAVRPYCLVVQPGVVDPTRAPAGARNAVGLLPRAPGLDHRHDRAHRGSDRAVRAGLQGPRSRALDDDRHGCRSSQPQLRRRRHQRRRRHAPPDDLPARPCGGTRTEPARRGCTSAPPPLHPVAACTGCAGLELLVPCSPT